ncbi:type 1 periplasmic binding fold superfamily protein [Flavobacterium magnesitis]|uniref:type 1 periplasmic binding fold superfamily protein n=1 Tax=Flavobacterium magnesitis TaxID=3138077 RepID=UPI00358ECC48
MKTIQKSKQFKFYALALVAALTFSSCSNDNDTPEPVVEGELITTVIATYTPVGGGTAITMQFRDLDGVGGNPPVITASDNFKSNTTYNGALQFKNELANPAEDITEEILELDLEHQAFYQTTGTINPFTYGTASSNFDTNGKPVGLQSVFVTTGAASGTLTITLRHNPTKSEPNVSNGDITNAGGSTDIQVTFPITVI